MAMSYLLLMTFLSLKSKQCNTDGESVWTAMRAMLKIKI